jgi:undecaprenyl pyrophosphate synthase
VRDLVVPLASSQHSELRIEACKAVAEATPQHIVRVMAPLFSDALRKRPEEEVRELSKLFVDKGGQAAVEKLTELVHRRGLTTSEQERELAVSIVRSLIRTPHPAVISMLDTVAKDWLVPQRIRSACKEIYEILKTGN